MAHLIATYGLVVLFLAVALESAGVPVPGETSLIGASILASQGHFDIGWVIPVAAAAAILGDNAGYWMARWGGRRLLDRFPLLRSYAERILPRAERFFARHGGQTVFSARFISGLRVGAAWIAGISRMPWWHFMLWNAAGGIVWATAVGLAGYWLGPVAFGVIARYGWLAAAALLLAAGAVTVMFFLRRSMRRRAFRRDDSVHDGLGAAISTTPADVSRGDQW
jgi:membrane protein DedA with SNARE-associated domain